MRARGWHPCEIEVDRITVEHDIFLRAMACATHELVNPLSVASGYVGMLLREQGGPITEKQRKMLEEASHACKRLLTMVEQMRAALLSTYIAYSGPCTINEAEGSVTLKVDAAWRPDYVGTEQKRFFRFDNGKLIFGPAPNSMRGTGEALTRRLTLERAP